MNHLQSDTFRLRLDQYQRRQQLTIWVAAALGGIVIMTGANVIKGAPEIVISILITLILGTGAAIGLTRAKFEWRATLLCRKIEAGQAKLEDPIPANVEFEWPQDAENWWTVSLLGVSVTGIVFLVAAWWAPVSNLIGST